jgi:metal-sulfur cluster biosynthetic enzyme
MMAETSVKQDEAELIRTALRDVYDPEIGMSVVELGMIREITPSAEQVDIKMILTTPFCPLARMMVGQVQQAAEKAVGRTVKVTLANEPWDPSMICQETPE